MSSKEELIKKYGGWSKLLDPSKSPPSEFLSELSEHGHSTHEFHARRAEWKETELKSWIWIEFVLWILVIIALVRLILAVNTFVVFTNPSIGEHAFVMLLCACIGFLILIASRGGHNRLRR
jgi:hypothetical protein